MRMKTLATGVALAALACGATGAAQAQDVLNEQIQLGDVFSNMNVVLPGDRDSDVSGSAMAYGNTASGYAVTPSSASSNQIMNGNTGATMDLSTGSVAGTAAASSTAYANSGTWEVHGGDGTGQPLNQSVAGGTSVTAETNMQLSHADIISASSVATSNVTAVTVTNGDLTTEVNQTGAASVSAVTDVTACCSNEQTIASATAVSNSYSSWSETSNARAIIYQSSQGPDVRAVTNVIQGGGNDIIAASTASGNSIAIENEWGYTELNGGQENTAAIIAETQVVLDDWAGVSSASAYGVGNSALVTNIGSDAKAYYTQNNTGDVYASSSFEGESSSGGAGITNATAIGNAYTGYVCSTCASASAGGSIGQYNSANVSSYSHTFNTGSGGYNGAAAAIGNSATFSSSAASN